MIELFRLDPETVRYLDFDSDRGPVATHAMAAMLLWPTFQLLPARSEPGRIREPSGPGKPCTRSD